MSGTAFLPNKTVLVEVSEDDARAARSLLTLISSADSQPGSLELARNLILSLTERRHFFDCSMFGDPAWDMLITLFVASSERRELSVTSLIFSVATAQTTGLRWIQVLERARLVARRHCPTDGRRVIVELTGSADEKLRAYFNRIGQRMAGIS